MNKKIISLVLGAVVLVGISFYAGSKYGSSQNPNTPPMAQNGNGFNRGGANGGQKGMRNGGGFLNGKIVAKDANSITVQLNNSNQNGTQNQGQGSKIVFFTKDIAILKTISGDSSDLVEGKQVMISGTQNPDGSVDAQSIQVRPDMPTATINQAPVTAPVQQ